MALNEEATIGLLSLLITGVIATVTFISWLVRQHYRRKRNRTTTGQRGLENGIAADDARPTPRHEQQSVVSSAHLDTAATRSLVAAEPPSTAEIMLATLATSSAPSTAALDFTASQAATSTPSAG
ncbi:hypothetical protein MN608_11378 [Microdochium nivale]|nr:hypothetical protein MN608_11378 [Microdochium nivale]